MFDALKQELVRLDNRFRGVPYFRWGVVTSTDPLQVLLDGSETPLAGVSGALVSGIVDGSRVRVELQNRRAVIVGTSEPPVIKWQTLPLASGISVYNDHTPEWALVGGRLELRGAVQKSSGDFDTSYTQILANGAIPELGENVRHSYRSVRLLPGPGGRAPARAYIKEDGGMYLATTGAAGSYYLLNSSYLIGG